MTRQKCKGNLSFNYKYSVGCDLEFEIKKGFSMVIYKKPKKVVSKFTVSNFKGGCAKTTVSVNLACCFAAQGKKTLVIDIDPQFNATTYLDEDSHSRDLDNREAKNIYNALNFRLDLEDCIVETKWENLFVVPGSKKLEGLGKDLIGTGGEYVILDRVLSQSPITKTFDIIIFDTHPSFDIFTKMALKSSDYYLIPVVPDKFSSLGLDEQFSKIEEFKFYQNPNLHFLGVVISRMMKTRLCRDFRNLLVETANVCSGFKLLTSSIPESQSVGTSISRSEPLCHYKSAKNGPALYAFNSLANELLPELRGKRGGRNAIVNSNQVPKNEDFKCLENSIDDRFEQEIEI